MSSVTIDGVEWTVEGAQVAIVERGRVLLQFRPWPPGWELPGGHCEPGEDPAVTAARETEEECGYKVRIAGIVGVYSWKGLRSAGDVVFLGRGDRRCVRGAASRRGRSGWRAPDQLPGDGVSLDPRASARCGGRCRRRRPGAPSAAGDDPSRARLRDCVAAHADRQDDGTPMIDPPRVGCGTRAPHSLVASCGAAMITALLFVASLMLVVVASELFTNAIEWAGYLLNLGSGATGSLLAALGTSLPETVVPIVALATHSKGANLVATGAVLGSPFLLLTLGAGATGVAVVIRGGDAQARRRPVPGAARPRRLPRRVHRRGAVEPAPERCAHRGRRAPAPHLCGVRGRDASRQRVGRRTARSRCTSCGGAR